VPIGGILQRTILLGLAGGRMHPSPLSPLRSATAKTILLQVTISNVTDGFWRSLFILAPILCDLIFPGSAEAYAE